jgi:hypothetical protein
MPTTETVFVGVPDSVLKVVLADMGAWRVIGERMLTQAVAICPVGVDTEVGETYGKPHSGEHLKDTLEVRFEYGADPKILIGSSLTRGDDRLSALDLVESGTDPHEIVPTNAKALRFTGNGQVVFAASVQHPGTKENRFVERAIRSVILESGTL